MTLQSAELITFIGFPSQTPGREVSNTTAQLAKSSMAFLGQELPDILPIMVRRPNRFAKRALVNPRTKATALVALDVHHYKAAG